jgi:hypothetical protein
MRCNPQQDDQAILLVRAVAENDLTKQDNPPNQLRQSGDGRLEAEWRKLRADWAVGLERE